jgi:hypothetical protein
VRRQCKSGLALCKRYARLLKVWGFEEVDKQAAELIHLGLEQKRETSRVARAAEAALIKSRHAFVEHVANCLVCSRHLVAPQKSRNSPRSL